MKAVHKHVQETITWIRSNFRTKYYYIKPHTYKYTTVKMKNFKINSRKKTIKDTISNLNEITQSQSLKSSNKSWKSWPFEMTLYLSAIIGFGLWEVSSGTPRRCHITANGSRWHFSYEKMFHKSAESADALWVLCWIKIRLVWPELKVKVINREIESAFPVTRIPGRRHVNNKWQHLNKTHRSTR